MEEHRQSWVLRPRQQDNLHPPNCHHLVTSQHFHPQTMELLLELLRLM
jgi:hypothetical protein